MMLACDLFSLSKETEQIKKVYDYIKDKKLLLVHYNHSAEALEKFACAINGFVKKNRYYSVYHSTKAHPIRFAICL